MMFYASHAQTTPSSERNQSSALHDHLAKNEKALFAGTLLKFDWSPMFQMSMCEDQFDFWYQNLHDMLNYFLPMKTAKCRASEKPWITEKYNTLIHKRQTALYKGDMVQYCSFRNQVNRATRSRRSTYYL